MKCLITGAYGFLGSSLCGLLEQRGHKVTRASRRAGAQLQLDLDNPKSILKALERCNPDLLINLIAMTDVDACERNPAMAYQVNAGVLEKIGFALERSPSVHLIHLSTDHVYDGVGSHVESRVAPSNVYAITKLAGEKIAERHGATVLRVNFVGRSRLADCVSLTDWIVNSLRHRREITLFDDVFFSPLHMNSLGEAIDKAMMKRMPGVFNLGAQGGLSKAEFGLKLANRLGLPCDCVTVGSVTTAKMLARRPKNMIMNSKLFEHTFGCDLPRIDDEIARSASDYISLSGEFL